MDPNDIISCYTCARLEGDLTTTTAILTAALEHDKTSPDQLLMPLLREAAERTPPRAINA